MQSDADKIHEALVENAQHPVAAEVDGVIARQHSLQDMIAVDRHLKGQQPGGPLETSSKSTGFRISRFVPPAAP